MKRWLRDWKVNLAYYLTWIEMKATGWNYILSDLMRYGRYHQKQEEKEVERMRDMLLKLTQHDD